MKKYLHGRRHLRAKVPPMKAARERKKLYKSYQVAGLLDRFIYRFNRDFPKAMYRMNKAMLDMAQVVNEAATKTIEGLTKVLSDKNLQEKLNELLKA